MADLMVGIRNMGQLRKRRVNRIDDGTPLLSATEWQELVRKLQLPPRQAQIVHCVLHGRKDKQIATELGMSVWTIRSHLTRVFERLNVTDRVELVVLVFRLVRQQEPSRGV